MQCSSASYPTPSYAAATQSWYDEVSSNAFYPICQVCSKVSWDWLFNLGIGWLLWQTQTEQCQVLHPSIMCDWTLHSSCLGKDNQDWLWTWQASLPQGFQRWQQILLYCKLKKTLADGSVDHYSYLICFSTLCATTTLEATLEVSLFTNNLSMQKSQLDEWLNTKLTGPRKWNLVSNYFMSTKREHDNM